MYTPGIKEQTYNGSLNTFGWNGKSQYQKDRQSGLMLLGHRYYDQSTGRFLSEDPVGDGANWFAYCENNPLGAVDPSGTVMVPEKVVRATASAIGSALGAVATASVLAAAGIGGSSVTGGGSLVAAAEAAPQAIAAGGMLGAAIGNRAVDLWYACTSGSGSGGGVGGGSGGKVTELSKAEKIKLNIELAKQEAKGKGTIIVKPDKLRVQSELQREYGGGTWAKMSYNKTVMDGRIEVHWYQDLKTGRSVQFKGWFDPNKVVK